MTRLTSSTEEGKASLNFYSFLSMRVTLVFPPVYYPWFIGPGLAYLAGHLSRLGHSVTIRDANTAGIEHVLFETAVPEERERLREALDAMRQESVYRDPKSFLSHKTFLEALSRRVRGIDKIFEIYRNTVRYTSSYEARTRQGVLDAIENRGSNLFSDYFQLIEVPAILNTKPDVVGFSINDHHQLIPAFILASFLKSEQKSLPLVFGGNLISRIWDTLLKNDEINRKLFETVDYFIHHEGEIPMQYLLESLEGKRDLSSVPKLIWRKGDAIAINSVKNEMLNLENLQLPLCDGFNTWTPKLIIPLNFYRGCWFAGICKFCDINEGYDSIAHKKETNDDRPVTIKKRIRSLEKVADDIKRLQKKYQTDLFSFTDEWFVSGHMMQLSKILLKKNIRIRWSAYARMERVFYDQNFCSLIARAGCKFLQFGLESMSEDVIELMRKHNTTSEAATILTNTHNVGIWNHVFILLGYPGERVHDALLNFIFLEQYGDILFTIKPTRYQLSRWSPDIHTPPRGIEIALPKNQWELYNNIPYRYRETFRCTDCKKQILIRKEHPEHNRFLERRAQSKHTVNALYTLMEKWVESKHWAHPFTNLYPYETRLIFEPNEAHEFASKLPRRNDVPESETREALLKISYALVREYHDSVKLQRKYALGGLAPPKKSFDSFDGFLEFSRKWYQVLHQN